jgi:hypothetical protein
MSSPCPSSLSAKLLGHLPQLFGALGITILTKSSNVSERLGKCLALNLIGMQTHVQIVPLSVKLLS